MNTMTAPRNAPPALPMPAESLFEFEVVARNERGREQTLHTTVATEAEARERAEGYGMTVVRVRNLGVVRPADEYAEVERPAYPAMCAARQNAGRTPSPIATVVMLLASVALLISGGVRLYKVFHPTPRPSAQINWQSPAVRQSVNETFRRQMMSPEFQRLEEESARTMALVERVQAAAEQRRAAGR